MDVDGSTAVVADDSVGVQVIDVSDPTQPRLRAGLATGGEAKDIIVRGTTVYIADAIRSLTLADISNPDNPVLGPSTPRGTGGLLNDVAVVGRFAFGADFFFFNGVPIIDVSNASNPIPRAILDFRAFFDDNGVGIAADASNVYMVAEADGLSDNNAVNNARLYVGQYLSLVDQAGIPPTVQITEPRAGDTVLDGETITMRANAADDVAVTEVRFTADGMVVGTAAVAPFETTFAVSAGVTSVTLGAEAVDPGGNHGTAVPITLNVNPDPRTTVSGQVLDLPGRPAAGIPVSCLGIVGQSGVDGRFVVSGVPTVRGNIFCSAAFVTALGIVRGQSAGASPVVSGSTDVGVIRQPAVLATAGRSDLWQFAGNRGQTITLAMTRVADLAERQLAARSGPGGARLARRVGGA